MLSYVLTYRKSKQANGTGDLETENPLYNADEKTVTDGRYLATLARDETHNTPASMKENGTLKNYTAEESGNRVDDMVLTKRDLAENTDYNENMPLAVLYDTNHAAKQDDPNANDYSIIVEKNGQDEIDKSGKASGCSDTYYSQIEIHEEVNTTADDESNSAIRGGPALMNSCTMSKAQQLESEQDSEYHQINDPVIATPFNEYDRIPRHISKKDCTRDSTYNHVII
ncbi:hypothetical protein DPMN_044449 [Dreissena polymorpha]|uniref:Uncharacterized protein n=1 Tax=Dreissena polymorpha TaxID=45954 RepID=A0A9D4D2A7_DREPO|nr:hypothetical protein DPMN_044449 [Dreissena polymorpha]